MGLLEVKKEILATAQAKADHLIKEAQHQQLEQTKQVLVKADEELHNEKAAFEHYLEQWEKREIAAATLEGKKYLFDKKKMLLQEVYQKALEKIKALSLQERQLLGQMLLAKAKKELAVDSTTTPLSGGVIVENKDHTVRIDYSFESLFEQIKEKTLGEVAHHLFN